jgi:hypothetical protein
LAKQQVFFSTIIASPPTTSQIWKKKEIKTKTATSSCDYFLPKQQKKLKKKSFKKFLILKFILQDKELFLLDF